MLRPCPAEHRGRFRELGSKYDSDQTGADEVGKQHDDAVVVKQLDLLAQEFGGSFSEPVGYLIGVQIRALRD